MLRTLVAIVDTGSMSQATKRVLRTQSALSLQIKRLEELVQTPLFLRDRRTLVLTPAGEVLLQHAREILKINDRAMASLADDVLTGPVHVGMVQDFADTLLTGVLARFARLNPETQVQVRVDNTYALTEMLTMDRLDIVLCLADPQDFQAVKVADMVWLGNPSLITEPVIPVAVLDKPCLCRGAGIAAIEQAGLDYRIVLETPSLAVIMNTVKAGLAITCRPGAFLGAGLAPLCLPNLPLPQVAYALHWRASAHKSVSRLIELLRAAVHDL